MSNANGKQKTLFLAQFGLLLALEAIVCFTPLGSIPIGPIVATLGMLPVIVTAIMLGTGAGTLMGLFTGLFSFLVMTFTPPGPTAFVFSPFYSVGDITGNGWSLVICFVPRILVGTVTGLCFKGFTKLFAKLKYKDALVYGLSGVLGSLTNTLLVMAGIYVFFGQDYATAAGVSFNLLLGIIGVTIATNGVAEAVCGGLIAYACRPLKKYVGKMQRNVHA